MNFCHLATKQLLRADPILTLGSKGIREAFCFNVQTARQPLARFFLCDGKLTYILYPRGALYFLGARRGTAWEPKRL